MEGGDEQAGHGRADHDGELHLDLPQGHGRRQLALVDGVGDDCGARGAVDAGKAGGGGRQDVEGPHGGAVLHGIEGQAHAHQALGHLGEHHQTAPVPAVDDGATDKRADECRR